MTAEEQQEEPGGNRVAGGCVLAVGLAAASTVAYAVPESAYFVAGLLATQAVRRGRALTARFQKRDEEPGDAEAVDIVSVLQRLADGGQHVRLTQLADAAGLPDTKAARALLDEAGIRIRDGVRAAGKNGPGVHRDDVPPLPGAGSGAPSGGCLCSSGANTNANNAAPADPREGLRVEPIGHSGSVVRVPGERRAYTV
ncbi:hypothetical protein [Streptomyces sp. A0592]|uniref:hypothetical protein n=1 Tax=Streptomyces sp. A0592 TaxID=2563099 RepID=UPI00109E95BF|nr:hypothetical protein [Streptomyces sp. A0592]THA82740.1 hypothetical protein E6U81_19550 [Streptomyces sp. A0592]